MGEFQAEVSLKCESPLTRHAAYFLVKHCASLHGIAHETVC